MTLSDHDLSQIDREKLQKLSEEQLRDLSGDLLDDLKESRERLNQNSSNSSRPPSQDAPWDKLKNNVSDDDTHEPTEKELLNQAKQGKGPTTSPEPTGSDPSSRSDSSPNIDQIKRKPGKQPGAQGFGRQQVIKITHEEHHAPEHCAFCHRPADEGYLVANTAFDELDIDWSNPECPGIQVKNTRHTHYDLHCPCGHVSRSLPLNTPITDLEKSMVISQWRLIGPGLACLIVCLAYRMRLSRRRIKEFLSDWLNLELSEGSIHKAIKETGACALAVEEQIVEAVQDSGLLHVDETTWKEGLLLMWLWVFCSSTVVAYWIGFRSMEILNNVLGLNFQGWVMSDGYQAYRHLLKRLRCWAHLLRKAKGLSEALTPNVKAFGQQTLELLDTLINAIYAAREHPPDTPLTETYATQLDEFRKLCETMSTSTHDKARALANEILNDWDVIFLVLLHPHLPLTNNAAERALRHWVILRNMLQGSRTPDGSRLLAMTISVIETCRVRKQSPWVYFRDLIIARRAGLPAPKLPEAVGG
jgi:hypothetical protein